MRKLIRSQTAKRLKKLDAELRRVARKQKDANSIHDLRVSIRRFRQELTVFEPWFGSKTIKPVRRFLRRLMRKCGMVRNCDVAIEVLQASGAGAPALFDRIKKERKQTGRRLADEIEDWRKRNRIANFRDRLKLRRAGPSESAEANADRLLPALAEDLFRAGEEAARANSSLRNMHRVRLKGKRLRYTLELFQPVYGNKTEQMMTSLKGLQEKLGAINDCATTLGMLQRDRRATTAVRRLTSEREAEFRAYWKRHFGSRARSRWKAVLSAADGRK
jgi:CHAD domain-containing protein